MAQRPPRGGQGDADAELADEVIEERNRQLQDAEDRGLVNARGNARQIDGARHPSQGRGVSIRTPEIVTVFDYLPLYNNSSPPAISRGGKLFDIQANARRVRQQQLYALLEALSKDPNSPVAGLVERLKSEMIEEMKGAQGDFRLYRSIHDTFYGFITSFDLKESEDHLLRIMQEVRDDRNVNADPRLINSTITNVSTFSEIMVQNHGFPLDLVVRSSNTKLLFYVLQDLRFMLHEAGPGYRGKVVSERPTISPNPFEYTETPSRAERNNRFSQVFRPELLQIGQGRVYHRGRLGLSTWATNQEFDGNRFGIGENLSFYETSSELGDILSTDPKAVSMLLTTALKDMSFSSAINSPEISSLPNTTGTHLDIAEIIRGFGVAPGSPSNILNFPSSLRSEAEDNVTGHIPTVNAITKVDPAEITPSTRPTPIFDPVISPPLPPGTTILDLQDLAFDKILSAEQGSQFDFSELERIVGNVRGFNEMSSAYNSAAALDVPELQPEVILTKMLGAFARCVSRLNPVKSRTGYNDGDFLDLAILSECTKNLDTEGKFPDTGQEAWATIPMLDLVNLLLYKLANQEGYYSDVVLIPGPTITNDRFAMVQSEDGPLRQTRTALVLDEPNISLMNGIHSQISNYLNYSRFHRKWYWQNREGAEEFNESDDVSYGGVYMGLNDGMGRPQSEPDGRGSAPYDSANDGFWNLREENALHTPEGFTQVAKLKSTQLIENLLQEAIQGTRPSIFKDIVNILDSISAAANERSVYFETDPIPPNRKLMKYSRVDTSVIGSFILQSFSIMTRALTTVTFNEATHPQIESHNGRYVWLTTHDAPQLEKFKDDLEKFSETQSLESVQEFSSLTKSFVSEILADLRSDRKTMLDGVDLMRAIVLRAQENIEEFGATLRSDTPAGRLIQAQKQKLVSIIDPSQQALAQKKYQEVTSRLQNNQYFDSFLQSRDEENSILSFAKSDEMNRAGFGDNLKILTVGIPDGFSRNVLDYRLLSNSPERQRTKVRVKVHRHDILLNNTMLRFGESPPGRERDGNEQFKLTFKPKEFDFDLRLFFKGFSPIVNSGDDMIVSQLDNDGNTTQSPKIIDDRNILDFTSLVQSNFILQRFNDKFASFSDVIFPIIGSEEDRSIFTNHALDHIAKTYVRAMSGAKLYEETFLIDREKEKSLLSPEEIVRFLEVVNGYVDAISPGLSANDYLGGSRSTRELLRRLQGNEPTVPITESVLIAGNGLSDDVNIKLTEDLIRFTKMVSPESLLFGPTSVRQRIVEPKLFERVFCMFIDPDSFEIDFIDPAFQTRLIEAGLVQPNTDPPVLSQITNLMEVPQFNQFYVEVI